MRAIALAIIFLIIIYIYFKLQEEKDMAVVYVSLIVKGLKKYSQVPAPLKNQVKELLIALELEYLIDEE